MIESKTKKGMMLASIAASMLGACSSINYSEETAEGHCLGVNGCQGTSDCATATSPCKGQNECKTLGFLLLSQTDCAKAGGQFEG